MPSQVSTTCPLIAIFTVPEVDFVGVIFGFVEDGVMKLNILFCHVFLIPAWVKACPTYQIGIYVVPLSTNPSGFDASFPLK